MKSNLISLFMDHWVYGFSSNFVSIYEFLPSLKSQRFFSYTLFPESFCIFLFYTLVHDPFWVNLLHRVWDFGWISFLCLWMSPCYNIICIKRLSFLHYITFAPLWKISWSYLSEAISWFSVAFYWSMCGSLCQSHTDLISVTT